VGDAAPLIVVAHQAKKRGHRAHARRIDEAQQGIEIERVRGNRGGAHLLIVASRASSSG
jgi:hypothetical protein